MTNKNNSRTDQLAADQSLIDGLQKNTAKVPASFPVGSTNMTQADVTTLLQGRITTGKAVVAADAAHDAAIAADKSKRASTQVTVTAFKRLIIAMFLQSPDVLGDFGLAQPKTAAKSAATKAQAAVKANATRKLLGTKGSQEKKAAKAAAAAPTSPATVKPGS